jgi:predicted Zn-dependent protease
VDETRLRPLLDWPFQPLVNDFERHIRAAQGYHELGMHRDALAELDAIEPSEWSGRPAVIEMRLIILMHARRWKEALAVSRKLTEAAPELPAGYIHAAFCLHELGRTREAKELLLSGPPALRNEATFHYNLACYECTLGETGSALTNLEASFAIDGKFRDFARTDPDLAPIKDKI